MGYIPNTNQTLTAYLTQKGREYVVSGDRDGFTIKYFGLGDPDVNYYLASQVNETSEFNMLGAGEIPDLSGDDEGAIHSLSGGISQRFTIYGGTPIKHLGTNLQLGTPRNVVRFTTDTLNVTLIKTNVGFQQYYFPAQLELVGPTVTGLETVKVYALPPSQGTSAILYSQVNADGSLNGGIYSWGAGDTINKTVSCIIRSTIAPGNYVVKFRVVPFRSAVSIDPLGSVITVNVTITQGATSTSSSSSSIGFIS